GSPTWTTTGSGSPSTGWTRPRSPTWSRSWSGSAPASTPWNRGNRRSRTASSSCSGPTRPDGDAALDASDRDLRPPHDLGGLTAPAPDRAGAADPRHHHRHELRVLPALDGHRGRGAHRRGPGAVDRLAAAGGGDVHVLLRPGA